QGHSLMSRAHQEKFAVGREDSTSPASVIGVSAIGIVLTTEGPFFSLAHRRRQKVIGWSCLRWTDRQQGEEENAQRPSWRGHDAGLRERTTRRGETIPRLAIL